MASLKDMRVRIASTKATQKITKAMQMVAASKLRRTFEKQIIEHIELRSVRQLAFVNAEDIAKKVIARFEAGEFDICTLFYSRFKSVIAQIPTAQQIIPLVVEAPAANAGPATSY